MNRPSELQQYRENIGPRAIKALRENLPSGAGPEAARESIAGIDHTFFLLTALGADLIGGRNENIFPAASAMEFTAYATRLLYDHKNTRIALALLNQSHNLIFSNTNVSAERAAQAHHELVEFVASRVYEDTVYDAETLTRLSLRVGAILAGADHLQLEAISRFAAALGSTLMTRENLGLLIESESAGLTAALEKDEKLYRLRDLAGAAKDVLSVHFPASSSSLLLLQLADSLAQAE